VHIFAFAGVGHIFAASPGLASNATASNIDLCAGASIVDASSEWVWSTGVGAPSPSCTRPAKQNVGQMCSGDPTSIVMQSQGQTGCFATEMNECKFNMRTFEQMEFDMRVANCYGVWAAPLWISPNHWAGGGKSGEIDMVEMCPTHHLYSNFAGASGSVGKQVRWDADSNDFDGHVSMWKALGNSGKYEVKVKLCSVDEAAANAGSCQQTGAAVYYDIYGSNGCSNGHDCEFRFISDIWNGLQGDDGFTGCRRGSAPSTSNCGFSIRNINVQGPSYSGKCSALKGGSTPSSPRRRRSTTPAPPAPVTPRRRRTPPASGHCCFGGSSCATATSCPGDAYCDADEGSCTGACSGLWCPQTESLFA